VGFAKSKRGLPAPGGDPGKIPCPYCDRLLKDKRGLSGHIQFKHPRNGAEPASSHPEGSLVTFPVPSPDPHFAVADKTQKLLQAACNLSASGPVVIQIQGPKGSGKTSLAQYFAAFYRRPFWGEACNLKEDAVELLSRREYIPGKGTITLPTTLTRALQTPGCVVLLDEVNRFLDPRAPNALFNLLDHRHQAPVEGLGQVRVAPQVVIFLTLNEGAGYIGTIPLDDALEDRVQLYVPLDYPPADVVSLLIQYKAGLDLATSELLARVWAQINQSPKVKAGVSTRRILKTAELITRGGLSLSDALTYGIGYAIRDPELVLQALQQVQPAEGTIAAADEYLRKLVFES
jgi:nitric oxide reductase NorQ protein